MDLSFRVPMQAEFYVLSAMSSYLKRFDGDVLSTSVAKCVFVMPISA